MIWKICLRQQQGGILVGDGLLSGGDFVIRLAGYVFGFTFLLAGWEGRGETIGLVQGGNRYSASLTRMCCVFS